MDLTLKTDLGLFNHRVAAVIVNNNKLLAQKSTETDEYYLVGGRIAFGESSEEALIREIYEELKINITSYRPIWINECFFIDKGRKFHEVGIYYLVDITNTDFNNFDLSFETREEKRINHYEWLDIDGIENTLLYPLFVKQEIKNLDDGLKLIVTKEAELL